MSRRLAVVVLLGLTAPACAYYPREDGERLSNEVYALQTQVTAMQQALSELEKSEKRLVAQLAQLAKEVGQLNKERRRNDADFGIQVDQVLETVARLKGQVESYSERVSQLEANTSKTQEELDLRFQNLSEKAKIDAAQSEAEREKAIEDAKKRERLLGKPRELLPEVRKLTVNGKPLEARKLLREFMIRAKEERSFRRYRPEAQYRIAETFFAEGNWQQAAAEYNIVRKKYPRDKKWIPEALYKLGRCFEKLELKEDAKLFYQTVTSKHRRSDAAKRAKKRLKALR